MHIGTTAQIRNAADDKRNKLLPFLKLFTNICKPVCINNNKGFVLTCTLFNM